MHFVTFNFCSNSSLQLSEFKPRKKIRDELNHKRSIRTNEVERGLEHKSKTGRIIPCKHFEIQSSCGCKSNCAIKIDELRQKELFLTYYNSWTWTNKTLFLRNNINRRPIAENLKYRPLNRLKERNFTNEYYLTDSSGTRHRVSQYFFSKCLQISSCHIHTALQTIKKNPSAKDLRGHAPSTNKTPKEDRNYLISFIKKFPKYRSHYSRKTNTKSYLAPTMTIKKMYIQGFLRV